MSFSSLPPVVSTCALAWLRWLDKRTHARLLPVLSGLFFATGRRTVSSWLRAGSVGEDFRPAYCCLWRVGREAPRLALDLRPVYLPLLDTGGRLLLAIDDSPTKRYGPFIEGASVHRNPTPGPVGSDRLWGHVWVSMAAIAKHPSHGARALPLLSELYVRQKDVAELPADYKWRFRTKLQIAAALLEGVAAWADCYFLERWVAVDGAFAKRPFLRPARRSGFVVVSRLRKDAALFDLPGPRLPGQRGRPRTYGTNRIVLADEAQSEEGWEEVGCVQYGEEVRKTVKSFVATWRPAGGAIRVVVVKEEDDRVPLFCTKPEATAKEVLEGAADRGSHEETFKDQKGVWGADEQQVRNLWANVGCFNLCGWAYGLTEAWAWDKPDEELIDRRASPWDCRPRRPSHADKRRALQRLVIGGEIEGFCSARPEAGEIRALLARVLHLAGRYDFHTDAGPDEGPACAAPAPPSPEQSLSSSP
jgi:hypothetical protein